MKDFYTSIKNPQEFVEGWFHYTPEAEDLESQLDNFDKEFDSAYKTFLSDWLRDLGYEGEDYPEGAKEILKDVWFRGLKAWYTSEV